MVSSATADLKISQDDKFYNRLLSRESSVHNPSFRIYYGVAPVAVPFTWESAPGTPKNVTPTTPVPPLTPPPSYQSSLLYKASSGSCCGSSCAKKRFGFLHFWVKLGVFSGKKHHLPPSSWSSPSTSCSSYFSSTTSPAYDVRSVKSSTNCFAIPRLCSTKVS